MQSNVKAKEIHTKKQQQDSNSKANDLLKE